VYEKIKFMQSKSQIFRAMENSRTRTFSVPCNGIFAEDEFNSLQREFIEFYIELQVL